MTHANIHCYIVTFIVTLTPDLMVHRFVAKMKRRQIFVAFTCYCVLAPHLVVLVQTFAKSPANIHRRHRASKMSTLQLHLTLYHNKNLILYEYVTINYYRSLFPSNCSNLADFYFLLSKPPNQKNPPRKWQKKLDHFPKNDQNILQGGNIATITLPETIVALVK